jgi:polyribonucleotide nucleotidyltransferase
MVEGDERDFRAEMLEAIKFAHEHIKKNFKLLQSLAAALVKKEVRTYEGEKR